MRSWRLPYRVESGRWRVVPWALFFALWGIYALTIDKRDLQYYDLHHTGAARISEDRRFDYGEYVEGLGVGTDRFDRDGLIYANKQPGSLLAGALVYTLLRQFGLSYLDSYFLTAALVTLLTSALCTALAALLLWRVVYDWSGSAPWALCCTLAYGLGTTAWPYTGTLHHDAMAAAFLFAAFYFLPRRSFASGLFLGLALTTSLLVTAMAAVLGAAFLLLRGRSRLGRFLLGCLVGVLPLLFYNALSFGSPFGQAVFVGDHAQYLAPRLDVAASVGLLSSYVRLMVGYTPITLLSLAGLWLLPPSRRRERTLILVLVVAHLAFVVAVNATGACQFGPRMLLPLLPFAALGLAGFAVPGRASFAGLAAIAVLVTTVVSAAFNLLGALYGTHFCPPDRWAVASYAAAARQGVGFSLPLLEALGAPPGAASREMDRERAGFLASEARIAIARGDYEDARGRLESATALAPDLALVHQYTANLAYLEGDLEGAAAALERALALEPGSTLLRENLARLRAQQRGTASP